jgi:hypothetical protein
MSGGSYNYVTFRIKELAQEIRHTEKNPRRLALAKIIDLLADAMYAVEWVDSHDCAPESEVEPLDKLFGALGKDPGTVWKANCYDALKELAANFFKEGSPNNE